MEKASLHCLVTDTIGEPLPGVTLLLKNKSKSNAVPLTQVTNAKGKSTFVGLSFNEYELTVSMSGFQTVERMIRIQVGETNITENIVMNTERYED
ncbi:carboxypeptidase-like regulatory domain-containing protein [Kordia zhangzhouensis]|uniref:carboxypeptidase-like regulatory domain-containing protein n=1 Tax=Kordia zhangzhouensis TaxID=1620405 RepID=UPI000629538B|nr:carboxypeptidase-like regulatory domain-containing protein [Kordia zhangzhouensis]